MTEEASVVPFPEVGIYLHLPEDHYHAIPALSKSLVKKFRISPIDAWEALYGDTHESNPDFDYGSALHCLLLEGPEQFNARYCKAFDKADHKDALDTVEDIRKFLQSQGQTVKASVSKTDLIEQVKAYAPTREVIDTLKAQHAEESAGKTMIAAPMFNEILSRTWCRELSFLKNLHSTEISFFWIDPVLKVPCKARIDALSFEQAAVIDTAIIGDIKTFTNKYGKPIRDCVNYSIGSFGYHIDATFYTRALKETPRAFHDFIEGEDKEWASFDTVVFELLFIEKGRPFPNVLPREVCVHDGSCATELGNVAFGEIQTAANQYKELHESRGRKPWNKVYPLESITEADIPMYLL